MTKALEREVLKFSVILPKELMVEINQAEEGGFWAKVSNFPGFVTQGENFFELIENINDAVVDDFIEDIGQLIAPAATWGSLVELPDLTAQ